MLAFVSALSSEGMAAQAQAVDIRLVPEAASIPSSGTVDLTIEVVPNGQQLSGIDACISFPANILQVVDADPIVTGVQIQADTSRLDVVLQNSVDNSVGVIGYSAGRLSAPLPNSTFTLATISMEAADVNDTAKVIFSATACPASPNNVVLGDVSVLGDTFDSTITVGSAVCGDHDGDGRVSILDIVYALRIIVGGIAPTAQQKVLGDLNRDGSLNVLDAIIGMQYIAGHIPALECGALDDILATVTGTVRYAGLPLVKFSAEQPRIWVRNEDTGNNPVPRGRLTQVVANG
jgi:hypothetical protein